MPKLYPKAQDAVENLTYTCSPSDYRQTARFEGWVPSELDLEAQLGAYHESLEEAEWQLKKSQELRKVCSVAQASLLS